MEEHKQEIENSWKVGTTSGMETRIDNLERDLAAYIMRESSQIHRLEDNVSELQNFLGEETPFVDEGYCNNCKDHICICQHHYPDKCPTPDWLKEEKTDLIKYLKIAHVGLLPGATVNQKNLGFYAIRGALRDMEPNLND